MQNSKSPKRTGIKRVPPPAVIDPCQRYELAEVHAALRQSHTKTFKDIREGRLATIRDGRRRYVLGAEILRRSQAST
jgi:hypothetical protein